MKLTTRELTLCAVLTALALALSYMENFIPLSAAIPLPGIKLGLANIVTLFALYALGAGQALMILAARCILGSLFAGNLNALIFSLMGGVTAMLVTVRLRCIRGWCRSPQLRPGGGGDPDSGQHRAPLLSAGFAGRIDFQRSADGVNRRVLVPGAGPYRADERMRCHGSR